VIGLIRVEMVMCRIMGKDLDTTFEYEEFFEGGIETVYKEILFGLGGLPFLLSQLVLLYSKASYDFETASTHIMFCILETNLKYLCSVFCHHLIIFNITYTRPLLLQFAVVETVRNIIMKRSGKS